MKARIPHSAGNSMNDMLKKAQQMQSDAETKQAELEEREYTAQSSGGMIEITVTGKHQIRKLTIKPEAVDPDDIEMLEDLITAAVNKAMDTADRTAAEEMEKITGGLDLSGFPGMGGMLG